MLGGVAVAQKELESGRLDGPWAAAPAPGVVGLTRFPGLEQAPCSAGGELDAPFAPPAVPGLLSAGRGPGVGAVAVSSGTQTSAQQARHVQLRRRVGGGAGVPVLRGWKVAWKASSCGCWEQRAPDTGPRQALRGEPAGAAGCGPGGTFGQDAATGCGHE